MQLLLVGCAAAMLAWAAHYGFDILQSSAFNNDRAFRVLNELITQLDNFQGTMTSLKSAVEHVNRILKRKAIVFVISDFMDSGFESALRIAAQKHDLIAITISDEREEILTSAGVIAMEDAETGAVVLVDTRRLADSFAAIDFFEDRGLPYIVGLNCFDGLLQHRVEDVREAMSIDGSIPIVSCDARSRESTKQTLITLVEHAMHHRMTAGAH